MEIKNVPRLSIIMPVFNGEKYISETLDTVLAQTFKDWEVVLMDGASKDNTIAIAEGYAKKYPNIKITSKSDEGPYHAIHKALALVRGTYVAVLCASDGYLNKDWLRVCVEELDRDSELSLVWGIPFNITEEGISAGPHFAYAHFLRGSHDATPFFKEIIKRFTKPSSLARLVKKINISNIAAARSALTKREPPQKKEWFWHW